MRRFGLIAIALTAVPVWAQVVSPGALQQLRIDEEERRRQIERLEQRRAAEPAVEVPAERPAAKADPNAVRFLVREIRFSPSKIFSEEELKAFARDYEGKEQTLAALQGLVQEINAAYRKRGVVTAQAVIPPQNVSSGSVEIRLVEGHLGGMLLDGNASTASDYITDRIHTKPGDLVDLPSLEDDLLHFNRTNDVQLQAQLTPGSAFATTDLHLKVSEPPRHLLRLFTDNGGSRSTGEGRGGVTYFNRSVFGYRDEFSLSATLSGGQESYSVSYGIPINRSGGRLSLAYYQDYTEIRHGPFRSLDITGESRSTVLSLRQPIYLGKTSQVDLVAGAKTRRTDNWVSDVFLSRTDTRDGSIGAEAQLADASGYWAGAYSYTRGTAEVIDRSSYWYGRGWLRRQHRLSDDWALVGSASFQHTRKDLLPSSEQFIIGGEGTVRGYPVGTWSGENGYTLSAELHHPIGTTLLGDGVTPLEAQGFFFADFGHVRPYRPPNSTLRNYEQLTSVGWGINATAGKHVTTRATLSYALDSIPDEMPSRYFLFFQLVANVF
jgi:hemolysin activation/secretion protein